MAHYTKSKLTSWEEAEFRYHRPYHYRQKTDKEKRQEKREYSSAKALKDMESELRTRFLIDIHEGEGSADKSVRALKYFCNCLGKRAEKNTAGGCRFCKRRDNPEMRKENDLIGAIINPVNNIIYLLNHETVDYQILLNIKAYVLDIKENLSKTVFGLMEIPFYKEPSGFMDGAGHNPAFKDILIQLLLDAQEDVYGDLANRIESLVTTGRDPFSYRL